MSYLSQKKPALYTLRCIDVNLYTVILIGGEEAYVSVQKILV